MSELWKPVPIDGFGEYYSISSQGRIRSEPRVIIRKNGIKNTVQRRILKQTLAGSGYLTAMLNGKDSSRRFLAHRLVALAFLKNNKGEKAEVNHINGSRVDNNVENLEWCTSSENNIHAINLGLRGASKPKYHVYPCGIKYTYQSINLATGEVKTYQGVKGVESAGLSFSGVRRNILNPSKPYRGMRFTAISNAPDNKGEVIKLSIMARQEDARKEVKLMLSGLVQAKWNRLRKTR